MFKSLLKIPNLGLAILILASCASGIVPNITPQATDISNNTVKTTLPQPIATPTTYLQSGPTSISTPATPPPYKPEFGFEFYQLRSWTEQDALNLLRQGDEIANTKDCRLDQCNAYVITLAKEALLRFPNSSYQDETRWKQIYREATSYAFRSDEDNYPVEHFSTWIEGLLNSGQVAPQDLEKWFYQKQFDVLERYNAFNLFGDRQDAIVFHIEMQPSTVANDAILILSGSNLGQYHLRSLRREWTSYAKFWDGGNELISIGDHTGNKQPEITSVSTAWGQAMCYSGLSLYEWRKDNGKERFVNIASTIPGVSGDYVHSNCKDVWGSTSPNHVGTQSIIVTTTVSENSDKYVVKPIEVPYDQTHQSYVWIQANKQQVIITPTLTPVTRQYQAIEAIEQNLFESHNNAEAFKQLNGLFAEGVLEMRYKGMDTVKPYLLYLMGLTSELVHEQQGAIKAYWQIWNDYPDSLFAIAAKQKLELRK